VKNGFFATSQWAISTEQRPRRGCLCEVTNRETVLPELAHSMHGRVASSRLRGPSRASESRVRRALSEAKSGNAVAVDLDGDGSLEEFHRDHQTEAVFHLRKNAFDTLQHAAFDTNRLARAEERPGRTRETCASNRFEGIDLCVLHRDGALIWEHLQAAYSTGVRQHLAACRQQAALVQRSPEERESAQQRELNDRIQRLDSRLVMEIGDSLPPSSSPTPPELLMDAWLGA
jgi:hypothetical protein